MVLLKRVVVPVANEADAGATATALCPYLEAIQHVTVLHVIEKAGGTFDKAPMEKRRTDASEHLATVEPRLGDEVAVETRIEFGTDVAETIVETAIDVSATAIVFRPRGGNRLVRFLSGDTAVRLLTASDLPVVSITAQNHERLSPKRRTGGDGTEVSG